MEKLSKIIKLILNRSLFIFIGLCLSVAMFAVQAAWNTKVANNTPLTPALWNDMVTQLEVFNARTVSLNYGASVSVNVPNSGWTDCPSGSIVTGVQMSDSSGDTKVKSLHCTPLTIVSW